MIQAIVFDIGSVLVSFNYSDFLVHLGYSKEIRKELDIIQDGCPFWLQLDRGLKTEDEGVKDYVNMIPTYKKEGEYAFLHMAYYMEEIKETTSFLREAKEKGYKLYYLSNFSYNNWEIIFHRFPFFRLFDGGLVSCHVHQVKPEAEIYQTLLQKYRLCPEETLFIDDRENNTATAAALGIQTITFNKDMDIRRAVREFGVLQS